MSGRDDLRRSARCPFHTDEAQVLELAQRPLFDAPIDAFPAEGNISQPHGLVGRSPSQKQQMEEYALGAVASAFRKPVELFV